MRFGKIFLGYEGKYKISSFGRVKALDYRRTKKEAILTPKKTSWYTLRVTLAKNGIQKDYGLAKLVLKAFRNIDIENTSVIRYKDGNPYNCSIDNLYVISLSEEVSRELANGRRIQSKFEYYDENITVREIEKRTEMPIETIWTRIKTLNWNIYETVETPIYATYAHIKRKERIRNAKSVRT